MSYNQVAFVALIVLIKFKPILLQQEYYLFTIFYLQIEGVKSLKVNILAQKIQLTLTKNLNIKTIADKINELGFKI